ncbi:MAG: T9SS type A sorting domain-containing protein [Bacteroidia bacterium]|nr:T9SS type A sorting domain-containing protein [Bacteroidia bacterium]
MKQYLRNLFILLLLSGSAYAQTPALRGIYIDDFSQILGNSVKEDSLLDYAQDSSYNYLALYDIHAINFNSSSSVAALASFIRRARENYGIQYIGAVGENFNTFQTKVGPYNSSRTNTLEKFNVFNLEFEFWTSSSVNPGGYYCTQYLQPNNCNCDSSGGFRFFISQMHKIDSLASLQGAISETYLGWFNQGQAQQIVQNVDRILLHAYRVDNTSVFGYSKTRLGYLASLHVPVTVAAIFSSEPVFMGPWLQSHAQIEAYNRYLQDFNADNSSWKPYIQLAGYHWFDYEFMPKPVPGSSNGNGGNNNNTATALAGGPTSFCTGGSVILTASGGSSFLWSSGQTTASINVQSTGTYTCAVTNNGTISNTDPITVTVFSPPSSSFTVGNADPGGVPLSSTSTPGSGTIAGYQWYADGVPISGANGQVFTATQDGDYTLQVTNSNGCYSNSATETVSVPQSNCVLTTPTGTSASNIGMTRATLSWSPLPASDSLIVRYKREGTNTYIYIRMANYGQTSISLTGLVPNAKYSWRVKTGCGNTFSGYSGKKYFNTSIATAALAITYNYKLSPPVYYTEVANDELTLYPNPAKESIRLFFYSEKEQAGTIELMDLSGKILLRQSSSLIEGDNQADVDVSTLSNGVYLAIVNMEQTRLVKRLIVHH